MDSSWMNSTGSADIWWLRSPGYDADNAMAVDRKGWVYQKAFEVYCSFYAVCPALHLNLSSSNLYSYAGTVSSDGTSTGGDNPPSGGGEETLPSEDACLTLGQESIEVQKGEKVSLHVDIYNHDYNKLVELGRTIKYKSADSSIAAVRNVELYVVPPQGATTKGRNFEIEGIVLGETDVTISCTDGHSVTCHVTVIPSDKPVSKADGWYEGTLEAMDNDEILRITIHPNTEFVESIYHANFLLERSSYLEENLYAETPSEILFRESLNTGVANGAAAWKALTAVLNAAGNGGELVDYDYTQKDMYMSLILNAVECSMKAEIVDKLNESALKDAKELIGIVNDGLKDAELIGAAGNWDSLSSEKKTEIYNKVCKKYEETVFGKSAKYLSNLKKCWIMQILWKIMLQNVCHIIICMNFQNHQR